MNLHRRHLTESQRAVCALNVLPFLEIDAKERKKEAGKKYGRGKIAAKIPEAINSNGGESREQAAKLFGTSARYVSDIKKIANENSEYIDKIKSGEITIPKAKKQMEFQSAERQIATRRFFLRNADFCPVRILCTLSES